MEKKIKQVISFILMLCLMVTYIPLEYSVNFNGSENVEKVSAAAHSTGKTSPAFTKTTYEGKGQNYYTAGVRVSIYYFGNDGDKQYAPNVAASSIKVKKQSGTYPVSGSKKPKVRKDDTYDYMYSFSAPFKRADYTSSANDKNIDSTNVPNVYFSDNAAVKSSFYVLNTSGGTNQVSFKNIYEMKPTDTDGYTERGDNTIYVKVNNSRIFTTGRGLGSNTAASYLNTKVGSTLNHILNFGKITNHDATKMIELSKWNKIDDWFREMDKAYVNALRKNPDAKRETYYKEYIDYLKKLKSIKGLDTKYIDMAIEDVKNGTSVGLNSYIMLEPVVVLGYNTKHGYVMTYREMRMAAKGKEKGKNKYASSMRGVLSYRTKESYPIRDAMSTSKKREVNFTVLVPTGKNDKYKETSYLTRYYNGIFNNDYNVSCTLPILGSTFQPYLFQASNKDNLSTGLFHNWTMVDTLLDAGYSNRAGISFYGLGNAIAPLPTYHNSAELNATVNLLYTGDIEEDSLESGKGTWQATTAVTEIVLNNRKDPSYSTVSSKWGARSADLNFSKYIDTANGKILHKIGPMYQYIKSKTTDSYKATSVEKYSSIGGASKNKDGKSKLDDYSTVGYYNFLVTNKKKKTNISTITKRLDDAVKKQLLSKDNKGKYNLKSVWSRVMVSSGKDSSLNVGYKVNLRHLRYKSSSAITNVVSDGILDGANGVYGDKSRFATNSVLAYPLYTPTTNSKVLATIKVDKKGNGDQAIDKDTGDSSAEDVNTYIRYRTTIYSDKIAAEVQRTMTAIGSNKSLATQAFYLQCVAFKGLLGTTASTLKDLTDILVGEQYSLNILVGAKLGDVTSYYTWAVYDYESKGLSTSGTIAKNYDISTYATIPVGSYTTTNSDGSIKTNAIVGIKRILIVPNRSNTGDKSKDMAITQKELEEAVSSGCIGTNSGGEAAALEVVHKNIVNRLESIASDYGNETSPLRQYFENRLNVNRDEEYTSSDIATVGFYQNSNVGVIDDDSNAEVIEEEIIGQDSAPADDEGNLIEDTETKIDNGVVNDDGLVDVVVSGDDEATSPFDDQSYDASKYLNPVFASYHMADVSKVEFIDAIEKFFKKHDLLKTGFDTFDLAADTNNEIQSFTNLSDTIFKEMKSNTEQGKIMFDNFCEYLDSNVLFVGKSNFTKTEQEVIKSLAELTENTDPENDDGFVDESDIPDETVLANIEKKRLSTKLGLKLDSTQSLFNYLIQKELNIHYTPLETDSDIDAEDFTLVDDIGDTTLNEYEEPDEDEDSLDGGVDVGYTENITDTNPAHARGYTIIGYGTVGKVTTSVGIDLQPWELNYVYADLQAAVMGANNQQITDKDATTGVLNWNAFVRTHSEDDAKTVRAKVGGRIYSITGSRSLCTDGPHAAQREQATPPNAVFVEVTRKAVAVWCAGWGGEDYATNNIIVSDETSGRGTTIDPNEESGTSNWAYSINKNKLHADQDSDNTQKYYSLFLLSDDIVNKWHKTNAGYAVSGENNQSKHTTPYWAVWSRVTKNFNNQGSGYQNHYFTVNTLYETAYFSYVYNLIRYISGDMRNVSAFYNYDADYATIKSKDKIDAKYKNFIQECLQFAYANIPDLDTSYWTAMKFNAGSAKTAFTYRYAKGEVGAKDYISEHVMLQSYMQDDGDNIRYHAIGEDWQNPEKTVNYVDIADTDKRHQEIKKCDIFYTYQENGQKPFYHYLDENWSSNHYNQTIQWTQLIATTAAAEDREHCHNIFGQYYTWKCLGHKTRIKKHVGHKSSEPCTSKCYWDWTTTYPHGPLTHCDNCVKEWHSWEYDISDFNKKCYHERCIGGSMAPVFEQRIVTTPTQDKKGKLLPGTHVNAYKLNYKEYIYKYVTESRKLGTTTNDSGIAKLVKNGNAYVSGKSLGESDSGVLGNLSYGSNANSHITTNFASAYLDSANYTYKADKYGVISNRAVFGYYPEVNMMAYGYYKGQKLQHLSDVAAYIVPTVAEIERGTVGASLNIMSIKNVNYDNKDGAKRNSNADYAGTTISDSVATSTQASELSSNMNLFNSDKSIRQVIYAGSDVTVTGSANFKLTLYGYAMDLIKPEDGSNNLLTVAAGDGTANTMSRNYQYIVANNTNLYQLWYDNIKTNIKASRTNILPKNPGQCKTASENFAILKSRYQAWVDKVTDLTNWSADYTLNVKDKYGTYNSKFTDFNATIGTLTTADNKLATDKSLTKQTNVYPLHIKNGEIIKTDAGYVAFINQLCRDYFGNTDADVTSNMVTLTGGNKAAKLKDYDRAEELFENSTLASCVTNAIENAQTKENTSGTASDRSNTLASELGTSRNTDKVKNWYDEEVRTIVLRRFKTESLYFNNITATDKIDYNTAPSSNTTVDNWTGRQADWYLNMYYQDSNTEPSEGFNTSTVSDTKVSQKFEVIRNLYVDNASFIIPSATTDNMGW